MRHLLFILLLATSLVLADSTRIEVYPLSQNYWDIKPGDSLGAIVNTLLPDNVYLQQKLIRDIVALNPEVFPDGSPHRMLANKRLWLPNALKQPDHITDSSGYIVETYQWGNIKKRRYGRMMQDGK
jgi:hypothetical protein